MSRLGARLLEHAQTDAPAVFAGARWWSYRELVAAATALELRAVPGDVVAIAMARGIEPVIAICAAALADAVPALIDPGDVELATRAIARLRPARVLGLPLERAWEPVARPGLAFVVFTAGSTADGKAVAWSEARAAYDWITGPATALQRAAPGGIAVPLCTALGLQDLLRSLYHGLQTALLDVPFRAGLDQVRALGVNRLRLTPTHVEVLLGTADELPDVRRVLVASAPLAADRLTALAARLPRGRVARTYGLTESGAATLLWADKHPNRLHTVGRPISYRRITVRDPDNQVLPPDRWGEIVIDMPAWDRGDGYLEAAPELAARFTNATLWTGDHGKVDGAGFVTLGARDAEILKVGGRSVSAPRIEEALREHGTELAIVGVRDRSLGEAACAIYVPGPTPIPLDTSRLRADEVPRWWLPRHALPRGPTGKLRRGLLAREAARWTSAFPMHVAPTDHMLPAYALDPRACVVDAGPTPWFGAAPPARGRAIALVEKQRTRLLAVAYIETTATRRTVVGPIPVDRELGDALRDVFTAELVRLAALLPGEVDAPIDVRASHAAPDELAGLVRSWERF